MTPMIYVDNAATTPVCDHALQAMLPYFTEHYANASGNYKVGRVNRHAIDTAREAIGRAIGTSDSRTIHFTASGTEADNWAIKGIASALSHRGKHIITTQIEHHAVLHPCEELEKAGYRVTYLPVDTTGAVTAQAVNQAISDDTILISVMYANNETGVLQPIHQIGALAKQHGILFHTDAIQALGHVPIDVRQDNIDLLSMSAHKIYGPKGVGALYIREGVSIAPLIHGGAQERNRRAGTENVAGIVGFGVAAEQICHQLVAEAARTKALTLRLIDGILQIPLSQLNGTGDKRLPHIVNFGFEHLQGEDLLMLLDNQGIIAASGSACTAGSFEPSHVLTAMGVAPENASLRISLGHHNTAEEVDKLLAVIPAAVQQLREISPGWPGLL